MTPLASLLFTLAGEVLIVTAVGAIAERILPAVRDRRRAWCAILSVLMIVSAAELSGLRPGIRTALLERFRAPQTRSVRTFVPEVSSREVFQDSDSGQAVFQYEAPVTPPVVTPRWPSFLIGAWLIGTLLMAGRCLFSRWQLHRLVRRSEAVEVDDARDLAMRLGLRIHRIQLREAEGFTGPVAFGIVRPTILLPRGFSDQHAPLELRVLLAHELAHLAARDPLWLALADGLATLLWWHPAVWWARRRLRATSEAAADEASNLVPGGRVALAEALVALGQKLITETSSAGFGVGGLKSELARRVTRLLSNPNSIGSRRLPWIVGTGFATALVMVTAAPWPGEGAKPVLMAALAALEKPVDAKTAEPEPAKEQRNAEQQKSDPPSVIVNNFFQINSSSNQVHTPFDHDESKFLSENVAVGYAAEPIKTFGRLVRLYGTNGFLVLDHGTSGGRMRALLEQVILPRFEIGAVTLAESVAILSELSRKHDPERVGINFAINLVQVGTTRLRHAISLRNVSLREAIDQVSDTAETPTLWNIDDNLITFAASTPDSHVTRRFQLDRERFATVLRLREPFADSNITAAIPAFLTANGIDVPPFDPSLHPTMIGAELFYISRSDSGNSFCYSGKQSVLLVRARRADLDRLKTAVASLIVEPNHTEIDFPDTIKEEYHTRIFSLNGDAFIKVVQPFFPAGRTNLQAGVRAFFATTGIRFPDSIGTNTPSQDQSAVFFNPKNGNLFVRASRDDLNETEKVLQRHFLGDSPGGVTPVASPAPNPTPPRQVRLDVRFVEVLESGGKGLDLDWIFGPTPTNAPAAKSGPAKELLTDANDPKGDNYRVDLSRTEGEFASLSPVQFAALLKRLETKGGVDILAAPRLITRSGQPARVAVTEEKTVVGDVTATAGSSTNKAALQYQTATIQVGPALDVLTFLEGDSARMTLTAKLTEFLGYDQPKPDQSVQVTTPGGKPLKGVMPLPHLRVRVAMATPFIKLGDTVVLRGPTSDNTVRFKDKVPVLGDIPLLGRLFRKEETQVQHKRLYVFVSPVEVDAKGDGK